MVKKVDNNKDLEEKFEYVKNELKLPIQKIGNWLWVDCTSASLKEKLEKKGFKYSRARFLFYYSNDLQSGKPQRRYYRPISLENLANIYNDSQLKIKS